MSSILKYVEDEVEGCRLVAAVVSQVRRMYRLGTLGTVELKVVVAAMLCRRSCPPSQLAAPKRIDSFLINTLQVAAYPSSLVEPDTVGKQNPLRASMLFPRFLRGCSARYVPRVELVPYLGARALTSASQVCALTSASQVLLRPQPDGCQPPRDTAMRLCARHE